ncbi:peptidyl-prolyl cis-trans [Stylonychia lemnae]|uniref:Peptidyl-prolyl cis-trans isomerase n=1 Tax=Stylonychia lemnae TaxID=5949 RepID=A0A078AT54_STYLE|nr:peptidyl-prolyl cis-trans [Stylonychia lemnae]|eukprot:CDW84367.1 peptidyl-prolyl cis-trans [Stylonychia lemnae]
MRYTDSKFHQVVPGRFLKGGDFVYGDGTGSATVYDSDSFESEKNNLKFKEPYLLAASANSQGHVGCQFFVTLDSLPALNGSNHTVFGRMISGADTIGMIEGINEFRVTKSLIEKKPLSEIEKAKVVIRNCGVYKFEQRLSQQRKRSAVDQVDFKPSEFMQDRRNK